MLPLVTVFARVDPAHKVRVVRLLREAGEVVAVTGDGANDAPAIRSAAAWLAARLTGTATRASTVALIALASAQLGQTLLAGRRDPVVVAACLASLAVLLAAVQVPGVSQLLTCRPVGPVGWGIALTAAAASTLAVRTRPLAGKVPASPAGTGGSSGVS